MGAERRCLYCNRVLDPEWARANQNHCDPSCKMARWYRIRYKQFYDDRYKRIKRAWERSPNGKRAGIPIRTWIRAFPEEWKKP